MDESRITKLSGFYRLRDDLANLVEALGRATGANPDLMAAE